VRRNEDVVFERATFELPRGSKVGVVGPNGAGKTTLLRALAGDIELAEGELVQGDDVRLGFLEQEVPTWPDPTKRVREIAQVMAEEAYNNDMALNPGNTKALEPQKAIAQMLRSVNFPEERWDVQVQRLSGGETRRLHLLRILAQRPSVLMLDEPTNDLDAVTVDALEQLLQEWPGTVIFVSHDRALLDGVCESLIVFPREGGPPRIWEGSYGSLREQQRLEDQKKRAVKAKPQSQPQVKPAQSQQRRMSPKQQKNAERDMQRVEQKIEKLEERMAEAEAEMEKFSSDYEKVMKLSAELEKMSADKDRLYERWESLAAVLS